VYGSLYLTAANNVTHGGTCNLTEKIDRDGRVTIYTYDALDRETHEYLYIDRMAAESDPSHTSAGENHLAYNAFDESQLCQSSRHRRIVPRQNNHYACRAVDFHCAGSL
jgi:YD repeat-containing protein